MNSLKQRWITSPERWLAMLALLGFCWLAPARAQDSFGGGADLFPDFSLGGFGQDSGEPAQWQATYEIDETGAGQVNITATLGAGWHIYSMTQPAGGPQPHCRWSHRPPSS